MKKQAMMQPASGFYQKNHFSMDHEELRRGIQNCDVNEIAENYIEGQPQVGETAVAPDETNQTSRIHGTGVEDATLSEGTITYDIRFLAAAPVSGELIRRRTVKTALPVM